MFLLSPKDLFHINETKANKYLKVKQTKNHTTNNSLNKVENKQKKNSY